MATPQGQPQGVDLRVLPPAQLQELQQRFEQELDYLARSFEQLAAINGRFSEAKFSLEALKSSSEGNNLRFTLLRYINSSPGKPIMIPLTSSVRVSFGIRFGW